MGDIYFTSGNAEDCQRGMKVHINVLFDGLDNGQFDNFDVVLDGLDNVAKDLGLDLLLDGMEHYIATSTGDDSMEEGAIKECTALEVKVIEGLGTTIDVILINGVLHEGDQIVVCGMQGPIVTTIRALLTPHPMKELRVKGSYQHHKELKAAQGIKITAQGLEHAIAGTQLYVVGPDDDLDDVKEEAMQDINNVMSRIDKSGEGVYVQASTLGSLEALLEFLKTPAVSIPVSAIGIGPVHKKDVMRASVMLEKKKKEYAAILAFDVKITPEARELADEVGVKIFAADIIYHLFDQFKAYMDNLKEERKKEAAEDAVFPCVLGLLPNCIFNKKDPIIVGVDILEGIARIGTPLCVPTKDFIDIGKIASIEINHKTVDMAKKGEKVAMKIVGSNADEAQKMFGRHFEMEDEFVSHLTRRSIDILKENYRSEGVSSLATREMEEIDPESIDFLLVDLFWAELLGSAVSGPMPGPGPGLVDSGMHLVHPGAGQIYREPGPLECPGPHPGEHGCEPKSLAGK
ncbi:eukaryotic translation initiation factor 5B-like [Cryptomeria japonica]|uniref:eukaryotic translation initiation factor 5B-like n=1 Tax=Cryptomeria japonica TaxID=3369 RepID=UPI0027DA0ECA|nr:eukaryotic translation initiation factor 5B-like [Cryptomeria japonica]